MIVDPVVIEREYRAGTPASRIAARFGVSRQAVERWARSLGLPKRYPKNQEKAPANAMTELSPNQRALLDIAVQMGAHGIGLRGPEWNVARSLVRAGLGRIEGEALSAGGKGGRLHAAGSEPEAHDPRQCRAAGCCARLAPRKFFCADHWSRLPPKIRSQLSHAARGRASPVRDDLVSRAAAYLNRGRHDQA